MTKEPNQIDIAIQTLETQGMLRSAAAVGDMRAELQALKEPNWAKAMVDKLTARIVQARNKPQ
jgi:hypothetical protein